MNDFTTRLQLAYKGTFQWRARWPNRAPEPSQGNWTFIRAAYPHYGLKYLCYQVQDSENRTIPSADRWSGISDPLSAGFDIHGMFQYYWRDEFAHVRNVDASKHCLFANETIGESNGDGEGSGGCCHRCGYLITGRFILANRSIAARVPSSVVHCTKIPNAFHWIRSILFHAAGKKSGIAKGGGFYGEGWMGDLDAPGEYHLNTTTGRLVLWPLHQVTTPESYRAQPVHDRALQVTPSGFHADGGSTLHHPGTHRWNQGRRWDPAAAPGPGDVVATAATNPLIVLG